MLYAYPYLFYAICALCRRDENILPIYRGIGCLLLLGWAWGLSLWVWGRYRINYTHILQLDLDVTYSAQTVWSVCTNHVILTLVNFLMFFKVLRGDFPAWLPYQLYPFTLFLYYALRILYFFRPCDNSSSSHWSRALGTLIAGTY